MLAKNPEATIHHNVDVSTSLSNPGSIRTWTVTFAIAAIVLLTMYGLAYWHEARGEANRPLNDAPIAHAGTVAPTH